MIGISALPAPVEEIKLDSTLGDVIKDLVGRAIRATSKLEEFFHRGEVEVGHAPGANFTGGAEFFEGFNRFLERESLDCQWSR
jgi:hypothetical protein